MDLLECQGKQLFARHGLEVGEGRVANSVAEAVLAADEVGYPVVIKAQVLSGGRGKAGGVKLAAAEPEARREASQILGMDIQGHRVKMVWVEHASEIASEYYAAVLLDRAAKKPLVLFSIEGGVEVEALAAEAPGKLIRHHVDPLAGLSRAEALEVAVEGRAEEDVLDQVADALVALYEVWVEEDALLVEINPLVVTTDRQIRALDAKVSLDPNASYRHLESRIEGPQDGDPIERAAAAEGLHYVKLDGDIGILGNGAGLVMSTLDVVAQAGGRPANFLDAGGGSDAAKVKRAVGLVLANEEVRAVLINIFGGITRGDEVARGLIAAFGELEGVGRIPFVIRLDGTNDKEGRRLLEEAHLSNVFPAATMSEAAEMVVALAAAA